MLNIYINTWGNYNEHGADGGKWFALPMDEDELTEAMGELAEAMGDNDHEFFINDYEWTCDIEAIDVSEHSNILKLNEDTQTLEALNEWETKVLGAVIEVWGRVDLNFFDPYEYSLMEDVKDDYDLGYYWAVESGCYVLDEMGSLSRYIDYEAFGRDIRFEADGGHSSHGWIERC